MQQLAAGRPSRRRIGAAVVAAISCALGLVVTGAVLAQSAAAPKAASPAAGPVAAGAPARAAAAGTGMHDVVENYPDGKLHVRYQTDAAGLKTGQYVELFPNGRPKVRGSYLADKKQGVWTTLDQAGKTLESAGYSKGVLEGPYQWTADDGTAAVKTAYHLGEYTAAVTVFGDKGRVLFMARYPRALAEIHKAWATLYPATIGPVKYAKEPNLAPPYVAGALAPETLEEGLRVTKLYRYLSGLPWQNVTLDATASDLAQHGAVVLHKIGSLTHTPSRPADMDEQFFNLAYAGCNQSNLHQGQRSLVDAVRGFMDDSDASNIAGIGHRRWVLFPTLRRVGFGHADGFVAMHVIDRWPDVPKFDFFAFPAEGYYPLDLIEAHYAWSIHIHASQIQPPSGGDVKVAVSLLDEHFRTAREFETKVVGIIPDAPQTPDRPMHVIAFKPELKGKLEAGRYLVRVAGLKGPKGAPYPIQYVVDLVAMPAREGSGDDPNRGSEGPGSATAAKPATKPTFARPVGPKK